MQEHEPDIVAAEGMPGVDPDAVTGPAETTEPDAVTGPAETTEPDAVTGPVAQAEPAAHDQVVERLEQVLAETRAGLCELDAEDPSGRGGENDR